jgi:DnaJ domain
MTRSNSRQGWASSNSIFLPTPNKIHNWKRTPKYRQSKNPNKSHANGNDAALGAVVIVVISCGLYWLIKLVRNKFHKRPEVIQTPEIEFIKVEEPEAPPAWFNVLHVKANATLSEIHVSYKKLINQYHPDKVAYLAPEYMEIAKRQTTILNAAYAEGKLMHSI